MGGIALGKGVTSSGLLEIMDEIIRGVITDMSLYSVVLVLSGIVLVCPLNLSRCHCLNFWCFAGHIDIYQPHDC